MNQNLIYYPCLSMLLLTSCVLMKMFKERVASLKSGKVDIRYFKTYNFGNPAPMKMLQADRNFSNLFEVPTLFYMVCAFALITAKVDEPMIGAAWIYVGCRVVHSLVHLSTNKIGPRMGAYALSWVVLLYMGVSLGIKLL